MITLISEDRRSAPKRRNRQLIIAQILTIAKDGAPKTQIMYAANLSFAQLKVYLSLLVELRLVEPIKKDERVIYKTTHRGARYLESYKEIKRLLRKKEG